MHNSPPKQFHSKPSLSQPPPLPHRNSYPTPNAATASSFSREETVSPSKDPVEHVRIAEHPTHHELTSQESRRHQEQQTPLYLSLQNHSHTPENRGPPYHEKDSASPYVAHDPRPQPLSPGARTNTVTLGVVPQDGAIGPIGGEEAEMRIGWMKLEKLIQRICLDLEYCEQQYEQVYHGV
ncbi:hypothetical protein JOM56_000866 [Amanita muscaria]